MYDQPRSVATSCSVVRLSAVVRACVAACARRQIRGVFVNLSRKDHPFLNPPTVTGHIHVGKTKERVRLHSVDLETVALWLRTRLMERLSAAFSIFARSNPNAIVLIAPAL